MFSEPGAGSDVAGLSTRAVRDGDEWVVNGQKVWTTLAHVARFGIVIVRTDPEQPKHKGLTMFVVDMHAPGVEVRPLVQATGEAEFNEVYFTDVRIPDSERLGDIGEGWGVSLTTLMNERVSIGGQVHPQGSGLIAARAPRRTKQHADASDARRPRRARSALDRGRGEPAHQHPRRRRSARRARPVRRARSASSRWPLLNQRIMSFAMDLMGPEAMLYPSGYTIRGPARAMDLSSPQKAFLRVQANSIEGGTTNIMKNILGERVLGLPGRAPGRQGPAVERGSPELTIRPNQGVRGGRSVPSPEDPVGCRLDRDVRIPAAWSRVVAAIVASVVAPAAAYGLALDDHDLHDVDGRLDHAAGSSTTTTGPTTTTTTTDPAAARRRPRSRCRSTSGLQLLQQHATRRTLDLQAGSGRAPGDRAAERQAARQSGPRCSARLKRLEARSRQTQHKLDVAHADLQPGRGRGVHERGRAAGSRTRSPRSRARAARRRSRQHDAPASAPSAPTSRTSS